MAVPVANSFDGGTNGATITPANSGGTSGDAFDAVTGTATYDNTHAHSGARSMSLDTAAASYVTWDSTTIGSRNILYGRFYFWAAGNGSGTLIVVRGVRSGTVVFKIGYGATGKFVATINSGSSSSSLAITQNAWVRGEFKFDPNGTSSILEIKLFNTTDSGTATDTVTVSTGGVAADTTIDEVRFGNQAAIATSLWMDDVQANITGYPGPFLPDVTISAPVSDSTARAEQPVVRSTLLPSAATSTSASSIPTISAKLLPGASSATASAPAASLAFADALLTGPSVPVYAGQLYELSASAYNGAGSARLFALGMRWFDVSVVQIGSDVFGPFVQSVLSSWTAGTASLTAPTGAVTAKPLIKIKDTLTGDIHYFDSVSIKEGPIIKVTLLPGVATATASAPTPGSSAPVTVVGIAATANAAGQAPIIKVTGIPPPGTATAAASTPVISSLLRPSSAPASAKVPGAYFDKIQRSNPVGYWKLDETGGTVAYDYGLGVPHNATYSGGYTLNQPGLTTDPEDLAVSFNGSASTYASVSHASLDLTNNFTMETWFKSTDTTIYNAILSWGAGATGQRRAIYSFQSTGYFAFVGGTNNFASTTNICDGAVHHLVATVDGSNNVTLYVDGNSVGSSAVTLNAYTYGTTYIGANHAGGENTNGTIDEVAIYNRVLPIDEIKDHYWAGTHAANGDQVKINILPAAATATASAPAPTLPISGITVVSPAATANAAGQAPIIVVTGIPPPGTATASGVTPTLKANLLPAAATAFASASVPNIITVSPAAATASAQAPIPVIKVTILPAVSTATAAASVPVVTAHNTQIAPAASATASAPTPIIVVAILPAATTSSAAATTPALFVTILPGPATSSAAAPIPTVTNTVFPNVATAIAAAPIPIIVVTLVVPVITNAATAIAPTFSAGNTQFGVVATANASAQTPNLVITILPAAATVTAAAQTPALFLTILPGVGSATASALAPFAPINAPPATATAFAPTPNVQSATVINALAAAASASAQTPSIFITVEPNSTAATGAAPAGGFNPALFITILPGVATANAAATGTVNVTMVVPVSTASATAVIPTVKANILPNAASAIASSLAPALFVTVFPNATTASAQAAIPDQVGSSGVSAPVSTATANAIAPTIVANQTEVAPAATANASAVTPLVSAGGFMSTPEAIAIASAPAPIIKVTLPTGVASATSSGVTPSAVITIVAPSAIAAASAQTPTVVVTSNAIVAQATATGVAPSLFATVIAPTASATALALVPTNRVTILVSVSTASASAVVPAVIAAVLVQAVPAVATATAYSPTLPGIFADVGIVTGVAVITSQDIVTDVEANVVIGVAVITSADRYFPVGVVVTKDPNIIITTKGKLLIRIAPEIYL